MDGLQTRDAVARYCPMSEPFKLCTKCGGPCEPAYETGACICEACYISSHGRYQRHGHRNERAPVGREKQEQEREAA